LPAVSGRNPRVSTVEFPVFPQQGERAMKRCLLTWVVVIATVAAAGGQSTRADDAPTFATPVKEASVVACRDCQCSGED
jgi:hypothetical protein